MTKLSIRRLLLGYMVEKKSTAVFFLLTMLIFFAVCLFSRMENMESLLYAFFLWAFSALCLVAYDFIRYVKKWRILQIAFENLENMAELLPPPQGGFEQQYRRIIGALTDELRQLRSKANLKETDMTDYYTMWAHQIKIPISAMRLLLQSSGDRPALQGDGPDRPALQGDGPGRPAVRDDTPDRPVPQEDVHYETANKHYLDYRLLTEELFKIEQYVEMVLYYQKLDSITSDFLFKKYDLHDIVKQALKKHSMSFINSRLSFDLEEFSCSVVTDEKWLQFVIGQVLSNSLKYTSHGRIAIRHEIAAEKAFLVIEDTGIGIRPEDLPRIFERGYTGYNGRLDKKSTGIGLYLCNKILEKLSHTIEVSSTVGEGTRVTLGFSINPELFP